MWVMHSGREFWKEIASELSAMRDCILAAISPGAGGSRTTPPEALPQVGHVGGDSLCAATLGSATYGCDDRRLKIDNNSAERARRAVALGRKRLLIGRVGHRRRARSCGL